MAKTTTIEVPTDLRDELKALKRGGESYAALLRRLLKKVECNKDGPT